MSDESSLNESRPPEPKAEELRETDVKEQDSINAHPTDVPRGEKPIREGASGTSNGSGKPGWFTRNEWFADNGFRTPRFATAGFLLVFVVLPLSFCGTCLISKDAKDFSTVATKTTTKPVLLTPPNNSENTISEERVNTGNGIQFTTESEKTEDSASKGVWAYGLQLAALVGALGVSLWAIVTLCRDE